MDDEHDCKWTEITFDQLFLCQRHVIAAKHNNNELCGIKGYGDEYATYIFYIGQDKMAISYMFTKLESVYVDKTDIVNVIFREYQPEIEKLQKLADDLTNFANSIGLDED